MPILTLSLAIPQKSILIKVKESCSRDMFYLLNFVKIDIDTYFLELKKQKLLIKNHQPIGNVKIKKNHFKTYEKYSLR